MTEIKPRVTRYEVCALPEDHPDAEFYALAVQYRGNGLWVVRWRGWYLGSDGTWDRNPGLSEGSDEWRATHWLDEKTALRLAAEVAPTLTVRGRTVADALADPAGSAGGVW